MFRRLGAVIVAGGLTMSCGGSAGGPPAPAAAEKPAIVLVAFGTTVPEARAVYDRIDTLVRRRYPEHKVRWGFTAKSILAKLRAQGVAAVSPEEALAVLAASGTRRAVLQSLHVSPGEEFEQMRAVRQPDMTLACGAPLLSTDTDIRRVTELLAEDQQEWLKRGVPVVIAAHGNAKHPEFARQLHRLGELAAQRHPLFFLATVEGEPGIAAFPRVREAAAKTGEVRFAPLMITAGDHVRNDLMGDEPESWKNQLRVKNVSCAPPLGENDTALAIFLDHLDAALGELK